MLSPRLTNPVQCAKHTLFGSKESPRAGPELSAFVATGKPVSPPPRATSVHASQWVVVGGDSLYRGASCLDSVDMLDVAEGTWAHAGSLLHPRCGLALALDARRSDLWVCGSSSGANRAASGCQRWCVAACERPIGDVHPGPKSAEREAFLMHSEV